MPSTEVFDVLLVFIQTKSTFYRAARVFIRTGCVLALAFFSHVSGLDAQQAFEVQHFAGSPGGFGMADDIGPRARFLAPNVLWGDENYVYVADQWGRAIRRITIATGEARLVAGSMTASGSADGPGVMARFGQVVGAWGDGTYLYLADCSAGRIRRTTLATMDVITIAGTGIGAPVDGAASQAVFRCPLGVWGHGRFLYVPDQGTFPIRQPPTSGSLRRIDLLTDTVSTVSIAGLPSGSFLNPTKIAGSNTDLFISMGSRLYVMDFATETFRLLTAVMRAPGIGRTIGGMWMANDGFLYLSDYSANELVRFDPSTLEHQALFGLASRRDWIDGTGSQARLREPGLIWGDGDRLYVADHSNHAIRVANLSTLEMTTLAGTGVRFADQTEPLTTPSGVSWSDGTFLYFGSILQQVWRMPLSGGPATVFAGTGTRGDLDGPGNVAQFTFISAIGGDGSFLYVIDGFQNRIRKVSLQTREVTTLVTGDGSRPFRGNPWVNGTHLFVSGSTNIVRVNLATGLAEIVAGVPNVEGSDDEGSIDGIGLNARFRGAAGIWGDGTYLYIADMGNSVIRRMSLATFEVTTIAGHAGIRDFVDGIGSQARFNNALNVWGDGTNLYITDYYTLRKLSLATNEVRTIAGSYAAGFTDGFGSNAKFSSAGTIWGSGRTLFIGDSFGEPVRVRMVDTTTGEVETIAGRPEILADGVGLNALFHFPTGIWGDSSSVYVTDRANHVLRRIDRRTGEVKTVAGLAGERGITDSVGHKARFAGPNAICSDGASIYVADGDNHTIRKVTIGTWKVETFAGTPGVSGGHETRRYSYPGGLWCDTRNVYISDTSGIRKVAIATGEVTLLMIGAPRSPSPLWSDGRFLYFHNESRVLKFNLATSEITAWNSPRWRSSGNVWGDGRYLYAMSDFSIQRVDLSTGDVSTIAGSDAIAGSEDGVGGAARFQKPSGIWGDGRTLYVADTDNHAIRTIILVPPTERQSSIPFAVPSGGSLSRITRDAGEPLQVGYARIQPDGNSMAPSGIAVYGYRSNGVLVSETGVPAVAAIREGRLYAENQGTVRTGLAITNPNAQAVTISFYFTDASGRNFGNGTTVLDGNRQIAAFLDEQPFSTSASSERPLAEARTFTFSASQPVAAIALRGYVNERGDFLMTTLPLADPSRLTSGVVVIPHFAEGGGWTTEIALVNPSDGNIAGTLRFLDQGGNSIDVQSYSIAGRSSISIRRSLSDPAIRVGSVRVTSGPGQPTPVGLSIFSYAVSGVTVTQTGVPTMAPASDLSIYGEMSASLRSGFAIANAASQAVTLHYSALSRDTGAVVMSGSLDIPADGQRALFVNELPGAQALPANFKGIFRISATGQISAIGLRGRTNERGDFLVSTTMPDQSAGAASGELYVPHFVQGGGYTTEFILMNRGGGSLQFYAQSGQAVALPLD